MLFKARGEDGAGPGRPGQGRDLPGDPGRQLSVQQVSPFSLLEADEADPAGGLTGSEDDTLAAPDCHTSDELRLSEGGEQQLVRTHHRVMLDVSTPGYELTSDNTNN